MASVTRPAGFPMMLGHTPDLDRMFHALADPNRRVMVERLSQGPAAVSELARPLAMSLPAVVQHLQVLEASGLVSSEKIGRVRTCRIDRAALRAAEDWLAARRGQESAPRGPIPRAAASRVSAAQRRSFRRCPA